MTCNNFSVSAWRCRRESRIPCLRNRSFAGATLAGVSRRWLLCCTCRWRNPGCIDCTAFCAGIVVRTAHGVDSRRGLSGLRCPAGCSGRGIPRVLAQLAGRTELNNRRCSVMEATCDRHASRGFIRGIARSRVVAVDGGDTLYGCVEPTFEPHQGTRRLRGANSCRHTECCYLVGAQQKFCQCVGDRGCLCSHCTVVCFEPGGSRAHGVQSSRYFGSLSGCRFCCGAGYPHC